MNYFLLIKPKSKILASVLLLAFLVGLAPAAPVLAVEPLTIGEINVSTTAREATITWRTNRPAAGRLEYGTAAKSYSWVLNQNDRREIQSVTLSSLSPKTVYYFQITATDQTTQVVAFERNFKTLSTGDNQSPEISKVHLVSITGTSFTLQWVTDEPASSEVEYGKTTTYGSTVSDATRKNVHDVTVKNLTPGTRYNYRIKSKDIDNNISLGHADEVRTLVTNTSDQIATSIYAVEPQGENHLLVGQTSAVVHWRTTLLSGGKIRYGKTTSYGSTLDAPSPRNFEHSVTLTNLSPNTTYYYEIESKDIFGRTGKVSGYSFTTKISDGSIAAPITPAPTLPGSVQYVLGAETCDATVLQQSGFYGLYYNLVPTDPGMEKNRGGSGNPKGIGRDNVWYNPQYFAFARIDSSLQFGNEFYPVNQGKAGDPFNFAVNWRAVIESPAEADYNYKIVSDDDGWLIVDGNVVADLGGVHPSRTSEGTIRLSPGYHKLEIFYADRGPSSAVFTFLPDIRLKFHPLPEGCEISDLTATGGNEPQVLGASNTDYTPAVALYKTPDSPDVWAILVTGYRHYITSPVAFDRYGYRWQDVHTVSRAKLESYPIVNLVRTPEDPTVYHQYSRPDRKWLKITLPSPTVFISYAGNFWGNVARIDALDLNAYPITSYLRIEGTNDVYRLEGSRKIRIGTLESFKAAGNNPAEVVTINATHADSYLTQ